MLQHLALSVLLLTPGQLTEVQQDFGGDTPLHPGLRVFGPNHEQVVQWERRGLRITLPRGRQEIPPVGLETLFSLSGDFEITLAYEILSADKPETGMGAGVKIWAKSASQQFQAFTLAHVTTPDESNRLVAIRASTKDGQREFETEPRPAVGKSGSLRLQREGGELRFLVAEQDSTQFDELLSATVGEDDIGALRISAGTADDPGGVSVLLKSLRIRSENLPAAAAPQAEKSTMVIWIAAILVVFALGGAGGWLWYRKWG